MRYMLCVRYTHIYVDTQSWCGYFHRVRPISRFASANLDDFSDMRALPQEADYLFKVGRGSHRPRWQPRKCNRWFQFSRPSPPLRSRDSARSLGPISLRNISRSECTDRFSRGSTDKKKILSKARYVKLCYTRDTTIARVRIYARDRLVRSRYFGWSKTRMRDANRRQTFAHLE